MTASLLPQLLDRHREALADCRACGHGAGVRPILSEARSPRVLLVGQAPGKTEIWERRPFAGRAGRTLFLWLARAGLTEADVRAHVYIAAVTRCYPGPSASGRGDRLPSRGERVRCGAWLDAELEILRPRLLILVGRLAMERFLSPAPLTARVGRRFEADHSGGRSVAIPLPHPSGASSWVHTPGHRVLLGRGLCLLRRELAAADIALVPARGRASGGAA